MSEPIENNKSTVEKVIIRADPTWKGIYKVGGVCMLAFGLIYIIATLLNLTLAVPPGDSVAFLNSLSGHATIARVIYGLYSLAAFILLVAAMALYLALKQINKNAMIVAAGLLFLFIVLDLH
jgi:hypothetical protein